MIISDTHRFVFIHIPKCAGSSVRAVLKTFDQKAIPGSLQQHPDFGVFDYGHIPLTILRDCFLPEYKKVRDYYSFAIMRDPFSRFPSSIKQRLGFHLNKKIKTMSKKEIRNEVDKTINLLEKYIDANILPAELIHFQKQKSYIFDGSERVVDAVYNINSIAEMLSDLEAKRSLKFNNEIINIKANKSPLIYKNDFLRQIDQSTRKHRVVFFKLIPLGIKKALKKDFYIQPKDLDIYNSSYVKNFIEHFYDDDIHLYDSLFGSR